MERLRRRTSAGGDFSAILDGEGRHPLVLIHGFPFDATMWRPQVQALRSEARLLAPDLPGMGASRLPPGAAPSIDDHAADVLAWMDDAGMSRAVVAGLSMGGYVALAMWRIAPERIRALALVDTKAEADSQDAKKARLDTRAVLEAKGLEGVVDGMLSKVLGATTRRTKPDVVGHVRGMILGTRVEGAVAAVDALRTRPDRTALLPTISVPTVVVVGEEDELTPPAVARAMADRIPGARLVSIPAAGHVTSLEAPEKVTAVLRGLLLGV
jgi:pimeloyl-ACP methyl ester carboxylesterase